MQANADLNVLFMTRERLDQLVQWDTQVMADVAVGITSPAEHVTAAVSFFRQVLIAALMVDTARALGCRTIGEAVKHHAEIMWRTRREAGFEPRPVLDLWKAGRDASGTTGNVDPNQELASRDRVRAMVTSVLASTDFSVLFAAAGSGSVAGELSELQRRLITFLRRTDAFLEERLRVLAPKYAAGEMSPGHIARVLGITEEDALALMDKHEIARPLSALRLPDAKRAEFLERIESDRAKRDGAPRNDPKQATRAALASQRLEGVDARACLTNR